MKKESSGFLFCLGIAIMAISILAVIMAGVGQVVIQCIEYGAYLDFRIIPHWTLFGLLGLITFVPGMLLFSANS